MCLYSNPNKIFLVLSENKTNTIIILKFYLHPSIENTFPCLFPILNSSVPPSRIC